MAADEAGGVVAVRKLTPTERAASDARMKERRKIYYEENRESIIRRARQWEIDNPDRKKERGRIWREKNRERGREHARRVHDANPGRKKELARAWRQKNVERIREDNRRWAKANPECGRAKSSRHRARKIGNGGSHTAADWAALSAAYGDRCLCCGAGGKLSVDHVVPLSKGGHDGIDNIQPLCLWCNQKKGAKSTDYRPLKQIAMAL